MTFANDRIEAPFFCNHLSLAAHIETVEWGSTTLKDGWYVRVLIREIADRRYAHYLVPMDRLEHMSIRLWPDWLESNGLAELNRPVIDVRGFRDAPLRQGTWEVSVRLFDGEATDAMCTIPTESFRPLMAWRGPGRGEVVTWAEATIETRDLVRTRRGEQDWDGRGDELMLRLIDLLLSLRGYDAEAVYMVVNAPDDGAFRISVQSDGEDDYVTWEIRHLLAHLYEWTEHCQGVPWQSMQFDVKQKDKNIEIEMFLGYREDT